MTLVSIFGLLIALLLLAILIGRRLPKTHAAASRIRLPFPPEKVFQVVTDFNAYPQWRPGVSRVEPGPELDGHPTWYEFCSHKIRVQFQVAASDPPRKLVTRLAGEKLPLYGTWNYDFVEDNGSTVLTITEREKIYSPLMRFFTHYILSYHAVMDVFLISLGRHLGVDTMPEHLSLRLENADSR